MRQPFAYLFERFPSFVQTFVYREASEMVRQGVDPWLVSVRRPDDPPELAAAVSAEVFYLPEEKALRAEVDRWRAEGRVRGPARRAMPRHRGERDSQRMFEAIWLAPRLQRRGIRHVHAHFGGLAARTAWWLRELFGIHYSFTGHANDIFCDTDFPVSNAALAQRARFIITETDHARRWMQERYPAVRGRVFRIFNGIDPAGFLPRKPPGEIPRVLSVGRCVRKKGFEHLIGACSLLATRGLRIECDIIGEGPLEAELRAEIERCGLRESVRLCGPRSQEQVREALAGCDVFVLACQPEEDGGSDNLPTVIAEAMFTGVPCISTTVAGVPEMIADGVEGLLVPPRDPEALAAAMEKLLRDPALALRLGEAGREKAHRDFAIERTVAGMRQIFERHRVGREFRWPWQ
jgi:glycosyltransferase involved in cell wall biosynthesis